MKFFKSLVSVLLIQFELENFSLAGGVKLWKLLSFVVAIPGVGVCLINATLKEKEHHEHLKHHKPEFIPYAHMYQRTKVRLSM